MLEKPWIQSNGSAKMEGGVKGTMLFVCVPALNQSLRFSRFVTVTRWFSPWRGRNPAGGNRDDLREQFLERAARGGSGQADHLQGASAALPPGLHGIVEGFVQRGGMLTGREGRVPPRR